MHSTFSERLEASLWSARKDRQQLAEALSISVQAIGQVLSGKTKALNAENTAKAARYLRVDPYWLATGEGGISTPSCLNAGWPFSIPYESYELLPKDKKNLLNEKVVSFIEGALPIAHPSKRVSNGH